MRQSESNCALFLVWWIAKNIANYTRGQGQAPPSGLPPRGGQTACPPHPLGNFYGLVLRIALGATRGDAELETDWERFGLAMGVALSLDFSGTH
jgi:hypothetical protein